MNCFSESAECPYEAGAEELCVYVCECVGGSGGWGVCSREERKKTRALPWKALHARLGLLTFLLYATKRCKSILCTDAIGAKGRQSNL